VFGDEYITRLETVVLESFDQTDQAQYDWRVKASKFTSATEAVTYPRITYTPAVPSQLTAALSPARDGTDRDGNELKVLGLQGAFTRKGDNWIDLYPVAAGGDDEAEPTEIPIPGRVKELNMWILGTNLNYYIEVYVRDYSGVIHAIKMGSLKFKGWKQLTAVVPASVPQVKKMLPALESLRLVKFRIWTTPTEQVSPFVVYFDQFDVLTDTFESYFDGNDLTDAEKMREIWGDDSEGGR
jgi:hypothetical protein